MILNLAISSKVLQIIFILVINIRIYIYIYLQYIYIHTSMSIYIYIYYIYIYIYILQFLHQSYLPHPMAGNWKLDPFVRSFTSDPGVLAAIFLGACFHKSSLEKDG